MENTTKQTESIADNTIKLINVEVTIEELNVILGALQELPHRVVDKLLKSIFEQAQKQV
jgi:hypothetical protein